MTYMYETVMGGKNLVVEYCFSSIDNCIKVVEMTADGKFHRFNWMNEVGQKKLMSELNSDYNAVGSFVDSVSMASYDSEIDLDRDVPSPDSFGCWFEKVG